MSGDFKTYLNEIKFEKYFEKLKKKIKDKKVVIYGSGSLFQYIKENYDFSSLNIIGISDMKYTSEMEGELDFGYKIIQKDAILKYNPDYVLVSAENYIGIVEDLVLNTFKNSNIKVYPLARIPLLKMIAEIWAR